MELNITPNALELDALSLANGGDTEWLVVNPAGSAPLMYGICGSLEDAQDLAKAGDVILVRKVGPYEVVSSIPAYVEEPSKLKYDL